MTAVLPYALDRTVVIRAAPEIVFRFFTDPARWAAWWGAGSTVDATPGGRVFIRYPNGIEAAGEVVEVGPPDRFVFTYGFVSGQPIPVGSSRVTIKLEPDREGTVLTLTHEFADPKPRDEHVQGWRYQLSVFANIVSDEVFARAGELVDRWFAAWSINDASERLRVLAAIAERDVRFHDRFSTIAGVDELVEHIGAALRFMPPMTIARQGNVRHCQGMVLADWIATGADGRPRGQGTNVFEIGASGRVVSATGFWQ